jgi:hypothetical protein
MTSFKCFPRNILLLIKAMVFFLLLFSLTNCASTHHRSVKDRKRGLMMLENTSQSMNRKFKKTKIAKKNERKRSKHH